MPKNRKKKENRRKEAENRNKEEENRRKEVDDRYKNFIPNKDDASVYSLDEDEMEWTELVQTSSKKEENIDHFTIRIPDMVWMIPPHSNCSPDEILGDKRIHLKRIAQLTSSQIDFNEKKNRIEMWGNTADLEEAIKQWDALANNVLEQKKPGKNRTWEKADKAPLNKKQEEKIRRRREREEEENVYKETTKEIKEGHHPFDSIFIIPSTDIPIERFIGEKGSTLDPVRIKYKCHIWHDSKLSLMKIVGNSSESVEDATLRVKYLFMKVFAYKNIPDNGWVHHMIEPLNEPHKIRIAIPPPRFCNPSYDESEFRLIKPALEEDASKASFGFLALEKIHESNLKNIRDAIVKALENIYLLDDEIKMRIRFGHVCLMRFPQPKEREEDGSSLWTINKFNEKVMKNPRILSKFSTHLATDEKQLKHLLEDLNDSRSEDSQKLDGSPFREFKIRANRKIPDSDESWPCVFDVKFEKFKYDEKKDEKKKDIKTTDRKYDGKIGLWSAIVSEKDILNINVSCLDSDYSWKLSIQTARRLSNDRFSAQGNFIFKLRFCPHGRLVYSNTKEVNVISVCEKTKWKYWWRKDYIVEVTRYEFWDLSKYQNTSPGIEILLGQEPSPIVSYGVTFYKKFWDEELSLNSNLEAGEVPEWHPHDIMDEEETDGTNDLLTDIKRFIKILQKNLETPDQH